MQDLTPEGLRVLEDVARRHAVSIEAVVTMLRALIEGNGSQAQFSHPDLGGMGQWSQGGMIMVGDMFNQGLKHRVDTLCNELAGLLRDQQLRKVNAGSFQSQSQSGGGGVSLFVPGSRASSSQWWPEELGIAASTGAQNDLRYACFPSSHRLAIQQGGRSEGDVETKHVVGRLAGVFFAPVGGEIGDGFLAGDEAPVFALERQFSLVALVVHQRRGAHGTGAVAREFDDSGL